MGKWKKSSEQLIALFHETLEQFKGHEMRKMFGYPCSFMNGNMFTGLHEENWVLRLKEEDRIAASKLGALPFTPMGRTMKEYVILPQSILEDKSQLKWWVERSLNFVKELPPKLKK